MSKDTEQFPDLDAILAEFSSFSDELPEKAKPVEPAAPVISAPEIPEPTPVQVSPAPVRPAFVPTPSKAAADPFEVDLSTPDFSVVSPASASVSKVREAAKPAQPARPSSNPRFSSEDFEAAFAPNTGKKRTAAPAKSRTAPAPEGKPRSKAPVTPPPSKPQGKAPKAARTSGGLIGIIFAVLTVIALAWVALNVHPSSSSAAASDSKLDLVSRLDVYMNNASADALGDLSYIKKIYKIDENATVAPAPDASKYGTVSISEASKVMDVIQKAKDSGLLDGQEVLFNPNIDFYYDSDIQYYCDDTILVICWKELIDGNTCSCVEVKIADASQFRRKIANDTYGSSGQYYATTLSSQANAVVAMNADFYMFRNFGIVAYQRQLYRFETFNYTGIYSSYNCIDNCFVTADGNFLFMHKGEQTTAEAVEQFMQENNVLFTIAFGPILVEDGVVQTCDWYPAGEPTTGYSRAGIGQLDNLHYFYMSLNHSSEKAARWTVDQFAKHIAEKGVKNAYGLDGGQTSEIVFQGKPYNYIDFNAERSVSDIIYFATAISDQEVAP